MTLGRAQADASLFKSLRDAASKAFEREFNAFLTAAHTNRSANEIIQKYEFFDSLQAVNA